MPVYQNSPIQRKVQQAVPGLPAYALGSLNTNVAPTTGNIIQVALASPTATVRVKVLTGNVPAVGQLISITGAVPSYFNVTNVSIASVTQVNTPDDGTFDLTFSLTNSNIGTTLSPGHFSAPQVEIGDSLTLGGSNSWKSAAIAIQMNTGPNSGRSVRFDCSAQSVGSATFNVVAQSADLDLDAEYQDLGTVVTFTAGTQAGGSVIFANSLQRFVRFSIIAIANAGTAKIVGKVEV